MQQHFRSNLKSITRNLHKYYPFIEFMFTMVLRNKTDIMSASQMRKWVVVKTFCSWKYVDTQFLEPDLTVWIPRYVQIRTVIPWSLSIYVSVTMSVSENGKMKENEISLHCKITFPFYHRIYSLSEVISSS